MASKRRTSSKRTSRSQTKRTSGRFQKFLRALATAAITSFGIASCALHPQLREQIPLDPILAQLGLPSLEPVAPVATPSGSRVQTQFAQCRYIFPGGQPPSVPARPALRELCYSSFAVLHSGRTKTPVLVAQRLNRKMLVQAQSVQRTDRFFADARLPRAERAELADYRNSGFSRGHMAPAGDMHTAEAMAQSFSLANMVPQNQQHNGGVWAKIERDTRKYIMRAKGDVYVFTGPVYEGRARTIGESRVAVPTHLYKLVYDATTGRAWVHWHANRADDKGGPPISYAEFVKRTGLLLLPR